MFDGLCNSTSHGKGQKFNNVKVSLYHFTFGKLQNGRDGRERNFQKDLMVLNRNYTDTRGEAVSAIEDADLIQPFIKLRIKSIRLMAFNQMRFKRIYKHSTSQFIGNFIGNFVFCAK